MSFAESFNWFLVGKTLPVSQMKRVSLLALVFAFFVGACEQHHWEDVDENGREGLDMENEDDMFDDDDDDVFEEDDERAVAGREQAKQP